MPIPGGALTVDATASGGRMVITVDTTGIAGGELLVWGESPGRDSWWVRGARGGTTFTTGEVLFLVDPLAPLGVPITYTLKAPNGEEAQSSTVRRDHTGHLITDLSGSGAVDFRWEDNGDPWVPGVRGADFDIPGSYYPVTRTDVSTAGTHAVQAETHGAGTTALMDLVRLGRPVIVLHNASLCSIPECDRPLVVVARVTSAPCARNGVVARVERVWDLQLTLTSDPFADIITPLSTAYDFAQAWAGQTAHDFAAEWAGRTADEVARVVWSAA